MAVTPTVFWAVIAVMAVIPWTPQRANALRSAWIPAPPPESEPAMDSTRGGPARRDPALVVIRPRLGRASLATARARPSLARAQPVRHDRVAPVEGPAHVPQQPELPRPLRY